MEMLIQERGTVRVVRPQGDLCAGEALDAFVRRVTDLMTPGSGGIVIDLSQVTFVGSLALSALVRIVAQGNVQELGVLLAAPAEHVAGVLEVTRLNRFLQTRPDVESAVAELASAKKP